ncbi:unnamed protein product [Gulo gulo]|uniref:Uncharacterized protein n=1 Tax=Gulo gulo TaxID=48420 RepID=A0A9X9LZU4_GULGU|nr:unnamed protein product [Gulo gulo]
MATLWQSMGPQSEKSQCGTIHPLLTSKGNGTASLGMWAPFMGVNKTLPLKSPFTSCSRRSQQSVLCPETSEITQGERRKGVWMGGEG